MALLVIIRSWNPVPNQASAMVFENIGKAMAYADEQIDFDVKVIGDDDKVINRTDGKWGK